MWFWIHFTTIWRKQMSINKMFDMFDSVLFVSCSFTFIFFYFSLAHESHVHLFHVNCIIQNTDSVTSCRNELTLILCPYWIYHVLWKITCAGQWASFRCVKKTKHEQRQWVRYWTGRKKQKATWLSGVTFHSSPSLPFLYGLTILNALCMPCVTLFA